MHNGFAWNRKCLLLGVKRPGCVVSLFNDTSSVRVGLFLLLTSVLFDLMPYVPSTIFQLCRDGSTKLGLMCLA